MTSKHPYQAMAFQLDSKYNKRHDINQHDPIESSTTDGHESPTANGSPSDGTVSDPHSQNLLSIQVSNEETDDETVISGITLDPRLIEHGEIQAKKLAKFQKMAHEEYMKVDQQASVLAKYKKKAEKAAKRASKYSKEPLRNARGRAYAYIKAHSAAFSYQKQMENEAATQAFVNERKTSTGFDPSEYFKEKANWDVIDRMDGLMMATADVYDYGFSKVVNAFQCKTGGFIKPDEARAEELGLGPNCLTLCSIVNGSKVKPKDKPYLHVSCSIQTKDGAKLFHTTAHKFSMVLKLREQGEPMTWDSKKLDVSHLCHSEICCNPDHLVLESGRDNLIRKGCLGTLVCKCGKKQVLCSKHGTQYRCKNITKRDQCGLCTNPDQESQEERVW